MGNKQKIIFGLLLFIIFENVQADEPPPHITEFNSQNGKYVLKLLRTTNDKNIFMEEWELKSVETDEIKYNLQCVQFSLSVFWPAVFISDDGDNIIIVNWFLGLHDNEESIMNENAVYFYLKGKEIKRYLLNELFNNINNGIQSASHLQWTNYNYNWDCIKMENNKFIIKTLELYEYIFNIEDGRIIEKNILNK